MPATHTPSFMNYEESKRFFIEMTDPDGQKATVHIRFARAFVVVTDSWGDKTVFTKTTRGRNFGDSRTPKKQIPAEECLSELSRILCCPRKGAAAFSALDI